MAKKQDGRVSLIKDGKLTKHGKDVQKALEKKFPSLKNTTPPSKKKEKANPLLRRYQKEFEKDTPKKVPKIDHKKLWDGMPEFEQESAQPIKKIIVGFATQEDILKFSKLVGQQITPKTRSIWYPPLVHKPIYNKRWSDKNKKK